MQPGEVRKTVLDEWTIGVDFSNGNVCFIVRSGDYSEGFVMRPPDMKRIAEAFTKTVAEFEAKNGPIDMSKTHPVMTPSPIQFGKRK